MKTTVRVLGICLVLMVASAGCRTSAPSTYDLPAVTGFDVGRYVGTWHEIARLPQWFERDLNQVTATYSLDGETLRIVNRGVRNGEKKIATAVGHFKGAHDVGEFRISFFRPFYGDYRILWLSEKYDCALVTSSDRSSFWVLARTPTIPVERRDELLKKASAWGFDVSRLEFPAP